MVRERARTFCSAFRAARLTFGKAMDPRNHPLGARYEEMDAVALFDDVFIPWERVFCYRDIDICNQFYDVTEDETGMHHRGPKTSNPQRINLQLPPHALDRFADLRKTVRPRGQ